MAPSDFSPNQAYIAAQAFASSGRYADAIEAYTLVIRGDLCHISALVGRALAFQRIGEHLNALSDFDTVISSNTDWPSIVVVYYGRAVSRQALGRTIEAIEDCDEAIRRNPEYVDALYLRGIALKALGHLEPALRDMDAVLRIDPSYQEAYLVRGGLHYLLQHLEQAVADLTAAIECITEGAPNLRECLYLRGVVAQQLGNHLAAIADFSRIIEMVSSEGGAYLRRSQSYREIGEFALAEADIQLGMSIVRRDRTLEGPHT